MLRFFRKPKWQHKDPDVRVSALTALTLSEHDHLSVLKSLATTDPDTKVRKAALARLDDDSLYCELYVATPKDAELYPWLQQKIFSGIKQQKLDDATLSQLLNSHAEPALLELLLRHAPKVEMRQQILASIDKDSLLADVVLHDSSHELRMQALDKIKKETVLKRLLKDVKNKDKIVARTLKTKLQSFEELRQLPVQLSQELEKCCVELEGACILKQHKDVDTVLHAVAQHYSAIMQQSESAGAVLEASVSSRYQRALQKANKHEQQLKQQLQAEQAERERLQTQIAAYDDLVAECMQLRGQIGSKLSQQDLQGIIALQDRYDGLVARYTALPALPAKIIQEQQQQFAALQQSLQTIFKEAAQVVQLRQRRTEILDTLSELAQNDEAFNRFSQQQFKQKVKGCLLQQSFSEIEDAAPVELVALIEQLTLRLQQRDQQWNDAEKECGKLISIATNAYTQGQFKKAKGIFHKVEPLFASLPEFKQSKLQRRFEQLQQDISDVKDWQAFVSTPRKEALCAVVEGLVEQPKSIAEQAQLIKEARELWKTLGPAEGELEETLWQRFNQACEAAYAPCKQHYEQQGLERQQNLQARQRYCEQFANYLSDIDWDNFEKWKTLEQKIVEFRDGWRAFGPTDRKDKTVLQKHYHALLDEAHQHIERHRKQNTQLKKQLIFQAEQLLQSDNLDEAIEAVKSIQSRWKQVGRAVKGEDKQLWLEFRRHCDALFNKREQQRDSEKQQQSALVHQQRSIIEQLQTALQSIQSGDLQPYYQRDELLVQWNQCDKLYNKKQQQKLQQQFDVCFQQIDVHYKQQVQLATLAEMDAWYQQDQTLTALEQSTTADVEQVPVEIQQNPLFKQRIAALSVATSDTSLEIIKKNEADALLSLQQCCFDLEILLGLESPQEWVQSRMAYQLSLLSDKMTSGVALRETSVFQQGIEIQQRWLSLNKNVLDDSLSVRYQELLSQWRDAVAE